jgi:uncharacterized protein with PIN domain
VRTILPLGRRCKYCNTSLVTVSLTRPADKELFKRPSTVALCPYCDKTNDGRGG